MKLRVGVLLMVVAGACVSLVLRNSEAGREGDYRWTKAIETGVNTWPRWVHPISFHNHQLTMIADDATWTSADGIAWTNTPNNAKRAARPGAAQFHFKGKYWLMGGMVSWAEFTNEIWSSTDAVNWVLATKNAPWPPRRNALVIEFNDKLWLFGGSESSGKPDVLPTRFFNDVWQTSDGVSWTRVDADVPAGNEQILVFNKQVWILGRSGAWSSNDGRTWRLATGGAPFKNRGGFGALVYDGKMWVFGGLVGERTTSDVWSSSDGVNWQQDKIAPWFPRGAEYSIVFKDRLWIYGGKTGTHYRNADDVWFMRRAQNGRADD